MEKNDRTRLLETMQNQSIKILNDDDLEVNDISKLAARRALNDKYSSSVEFAKKIEDISHEIFQVFKEIAERDDIIIGNLKIVLVGGRLKNKPLDLDSDLDLLFFVDNGANELSQSWREIYSEVEAIFRKFKIRIKPDSFHFSAVEETKQFKKVKKPYLTLLDKRVN